MLLVKPQYLMEPDTYAVMMETDASLTLVDDGPPAPPLKPPIPTIEELGLTRYSTFVEM